MKRCYKCKAMLPLDNFAKCATRYDGFQQRCRNCQRIYSEIWRNANRERIRESGFNYRKNNPEKRKASVLAWDSANRERNRARHAADRKANPEKYKEKYRAYQQANRGKETARVARWRAENRDIAREAITRYRTRKRNAFVAPVNRAEIYERDKGICQICFLPVTKDEASLDHVIPLSRGGTHEPSNVQIAHGRCNSSKGPRILTSLRKGENTRSMDLDR